MKILFIDRISAISSDLLLSALLDIGVPYEQILSQYKTLGLYNGNGFSVNKTLLGETIATEMSCDLPVFIENTEPKNKTITLKETLDIINNSQLNKSVREDCRKIIYTFAQAVSTIKSIGLDYVLSKNQISFESLLELIGISVALEFLEIKSVYLSALPLVIDQGNDETSEFPITLEILRTIHAPITGMNAKSSHITPLGAAIIATYASFGVPEIKMESIGYGAGKRESKWSYPLRVILGTRDDPTDEIVEIETNIDDMNPQLFGHVMKKLYDSGAFDVFFTPIFMKKNRPATKISVIASKRDEWILSNIILRETSTLGLRVSSKRKVESSVEIRKIRTQYGLIPVKLKIINGEIIHASPEFDICLEISEKMDTPLGQIMQEAIASSYSEQKSR